MFHSCKIDHKINKIHEKALRLAYKDMVLTFEQLLAKNKSVTTHERSLQSPIFETFKTKSHLNPDLVIELFKNRNVSNNLRSGDDTL